MIAFHLMASSKKGVSAHQLHRTLDIGYEAAWFMAHRIREAMRAEGVDGPLGGEGEIVEADETYYGKVDEPPTKTTSGRPFIKKGRAAAKRPIVPLVERGGKVRSFHVAAATKKTVGKIVRENIAKALRLHTDESRLYTEIGKEFAKHETVCHSSGEYVRGQTSIRTAQKAISACSKRG